jgi:hypothetical protein
VRGALGKSHIVGDLMSIGGLRYFAHCGAWGKESDLLSAEG